jgi:cell division protein FtsL
MITKISRYATLIILICGLVAINIFINTKSIELSQKAMHYEKQIKDLGGENVELETKIAKLTSYTFISAIAELSGYSRQNTAYKTPVRKFAQR